MTDYGWNEHDVATKPVRIVITAGRCEGCVLIAQRSDGSWVMALKHKGPTSGTYGLPRLDADQCNIFDTLEQAIDAGLVRLRLVAKEQSESTNSCMSAGEHRDWARIAEQTEYVQRERAERHERHT